MNVTKIVSLILFICSVSLAVYLTRDIKTEIDAKERIASQEAAVIYKLQLIREAETAYQEVNGKYTSDWDKLADFIKNGQFPIIERKEEIFTLAYGADSTVVTYDTLGMIPAKERIFYETHNVTAANHGIFVKFVAKLGDQVTKNSSAYVLKQEGKNSTHKFRDNGEVVRIEDVKPGQELSKGDLLMSLKETRFNPNTDLSKLAYVPGYEDVKFEIYAAQLDKSGTSVNVIEVKNPKPFDETRTEDADSKNRRPLRFGSRTDVTTSGNWE
ncbi:hypothetical protein [Fulvivirga sediminis]|uniref:Uncharacterized protein n=1 Tax=Fulvivirga sediminis TaxID=2803949 RepID=A0A937F716_9BACT|nr:hypothetical protein [Fulvivirga sediminis]MBL3656206.1 hypothetical protein [Fulvivirga sediminis]